MKHEIHKLGRQVDEPGGLFTGDVCSSKAYDHFLLLNNETARVGLWILTPSGKNVSRSEAVFVFSVTFYWDV